jgi:hypothetical protein
MAYLIIFFDISMYCIFVNAIYLYVNQRKWSALNTKVSFIFIKKKKCMDFDTEWIQTSAISQFQ